jgi:dolichol-phosphate mannosyltransferase
VAATAQVPVRLIHRAEGSRSGGLSGAVVEGLRPAASPYVCVMDGDLQHPPERLPDLLERARASHADIVVATRYGHHGPHTALSLPRKIVSHVAGACSHVLFRRLRGVTDPMSGFFLVRRDAVDLDRLRPIGFKILLEILVRTPGLRRAEVPFEFGDRHAGESKANGLEGVRFLAQLLRLCVPPPESRVRRAAAFALVGAVGLLVNQGAMWAAVEVAGLGYLLGAALATQVSTSSNFALSDLWVFRSGGRIGRRRRFAAFLAVNNLLLVLRAPFLVALVSLARLHYLVANLLTLLGLFVARFLIADRVIWRSPSMSLTTPTNQRLAAGASRVIDLRVHARPGRVVSGRRKVGASHCYDVHGILTIRSAVRLPELGFFAVPELERADVTIEVGTVGSRRPRRRSQCEQASGSVLYREHGGGLVANFAIDIADEIRVVVSPWLARSPHVVYTNIVEALLRFLLVSKGYMLLHSACVTIGGENVMLSAKTDTGKTGTILRLLRERGGEFLSDDMTIVDGDGNALCYPKPLTISAHTLRAVDARVLRVRQKALLAVQSRLHSKEGRSMGARLAQMNLPIMFLNATTQAVVPPPKYMVDRLVPCEFGHRAKVKELFVIERGTPRIGDIDRDALVDELIDNTDDAYGFPPFAQFAPTIAIGGDGYLTLREKERAILTSAVRSIRARRVASNSFAWADLIPELLAPAPRPTGVVRPPVNEAVAGG